MLNKRLQWLRTSPERANAVIEEIGQGSEPHMNFYLLLLVSALIASFGLLANSTAVVIGAMLVSPLMTPILGIALSLVRGDARLFGRAIRAEIFGVFLAVGVSALFGLLPVITEATPEMLSRTQPNLLDLLVALLAGFAGAVAMVDERISPALPGVAIATAIVPPLSNTGLCLAIGAYEGATGSFLLFLANFISILLMASALFYFAGLAPKFSRETGWEFGRRFGWATLGFFLVAALLTNSLVGIIKERALARTIKDVLTKELAATNGVVLDREFHDSEGNTIRVLASVRTPKVLLPKQVEKFQTSLSEKLEKPCELVVRNQLVKDVSAPESTVTASTVNLDGVQMDTDPNSQQVKIRKAEQVLFEYISSHPGFRLLDVDYGVIPAGRVVSTAIEGLRYPTREEITEMEGLIQARLQDPEVNLIIRFMKSDLLGRHGMILYGWNRIELEHPEIDQLINEMNTVVNMAFEPHPDVDPLRIYHDMTEDKWQILVEAVGNRILTPGELMQIESIIQERTGRKVSLSVWTRLEAVTQKSGYISIDQLLEKTWPEREKKILEMWHSAQ